MSKSRNKNGSEVEFLRGKLRNLESENKSLRKRLRKLEKKEHWFYGVAEEDPEVMTIQEDVDRCQACGKGKLNSVDLKHLVIVTCDTCGDKKRYKPNGTEIKVPDNSKVKRSK